MPNTLVTGSIFGFPAQTIATFDAAYTASQPAPIRDLMLMDASNASDGTNPRALKASTLAMEGYAIDVPIMAWGWDPYMTMYQRQLNGLKTVLDGLGQVALLVSTNPADFPPQPAPPIDPTAAYIGSPIGGLAYEGAAWFPTLLTIQSKLPDGIEIPSYEGHSFKLQVKASQTGLMAGQTQLIYAWIQTSN